METKEFPLGVLLSLTTGRLLCKFPEMHEAAEWVMGHPIWTHEFADRGLFDRMKAAVIEQHPDLVDVTAEEMTEDWQAWLLEKQGKYGDTRTLRKGGTERTESPLESLERIAPGKPVIGVVVG